MIAADRVANPTQVDSDLMRTSGNRFDGQHASRATDKETYQWSRFEPVVILLDAIGIIHTFD